MVASFRQGLGEAGFVEGQNVVTAFRWAEGRYDRLSALAAELVNQRVAAILAAGRVTLSARGQGGNFYYSNRIYRGP